MDITWWGIPAIGVVVAVVELLKGIGLPSRYAGIVAALLGVCGGAAAHVWAGSELAASIVQGIVAGLAAAGLWSATKNAAGR